MKLTITYRNGKAPRVIEDVLEVLADTADALTVLHLQEVAGERREAKTTVFRGGNVEDAVLG